MSKASLLYATSKTVRVAFAPQLSLFEIAVIAAVLGSPWWIAMPCLLVGALVNIAMRKTLLYKWGGMK